MKKLVVISGGSKGIGRAIVDKFLAEGYDVAVCARNIEEVKSLGENMYAFAADVSKKEEVEAFADFVISLNKPIVALVNNAGVFIQGKLLEEAEDNLHIQMNTNLYSAYYLTRKLVPHLLEQDSAHIFNMCSIASLMAYSSSGSYAISKFALLGFSKGLREELKASSVKVTSIFPGATLTDSWAGVDIPTERFIKSVDVADMIWSAFSLSKSAVVEEILIRPQLGDL